MKKVPLFCKTCETLRKDDPNWDGKSTFMSEQDAQCYKFSGMCLECFKHVNGRYPFFKEFPINFNITNSDNGLQKNEYDKT